MTFPGMTGLIISITLSIATAVYLVMTLLYVMLSTATFSDKSIWAHLISTTLVLLMSIAMGFLSEYSRKAMLIDQWSPLWLTGILLLWLGLSWYIGTQEDAILLGKYVLFVLIGSALYFLIT